MWLIKAIVGSSPEEDAKGKARESVEDGSQSDRSDDSSGSSSQSDEETGEDTERREDAGETTSSSEPGTPEVSLSARRSDRSRGNTSSRRSSPRSHSRTLSSSRQSCGNSGVAGHSPQTRSPRTGTSSFQRSVQESPSPTSGSLYPPYPLPDQQQQQQSSDARSRNLSPAQVSEAYDSIPAGLRIAAFHPEKRRSYTRTLNAVPLVGSLYSVYGKDFSCLSERCAITCRDAFMTIDSLTVEDGQQQSCFKFNYAEIGNLRQHLVDAFQFIVRGKSQSGEEYGLQFDTDEMAYFFRRIMEDRLLNAIDLRPIVYGTALVAEYVPKEKEYLLLSDRCVCRVMKRETDQEFYLTGEEEAENDSSPNTILFFSILSPSLQIWPNEEERQITVWGLHPFRVDINRTMFLVEFNADMEFEDVARFFYALNKVLGVKLAQESTPSTESGGKTFVDLNVGAEEYADEEFAESQQGDVEEGYRMEWEQELSSRSSDSGSEDGGGTSSTSSSEDESDVDEAEYDDEGKVICRDPTDRLLKKNPNALLHKFMEVGANRTIVCRGSDKPGVGRSRSNKIHTEFKVYKKAEEDRSKALKPVATIGANKLSFGGADINPDQGILHDRETKLLLATRDEQNDSNLYMMDLEYEKVVQKWNADLPVTNLGPTFKGGQSSVDPTFLCTNPKSLFTMDTRLKESKARAATKIYVQNPQFSAQCTDESGHVLLGSKLGSLRLYAGEANYDGEFKKARTQLDTIKEPITAVDVTKDGSWIVATTKSYLVVFPTKLSKNGKTGFETALGQKKPRPRYLLLKAEDIVKHHLVDINFAPAKFDSEETCIVASTGNFAVVWDFGSVKKGKPLYTMKRAPDFIKDVRIPADNSNVVVAFPQDVGLFGTQRRRV